MTEAQKIAVRIRAVADRMGIEPTTLSRKLLGNGKRLDEIEEGGSMTMATFARVSTELSKLERAPRAAA